MIERTIELRSKIWSNELAGSIGTNVVTIGFIDGTFEVIDSGSTILALDQSNSIIKIVHYANNKVWILDLTLVSKITYETSL